MIKLLGLIPIIKGPFAPEALSYFSINQVSRGDLVKIPLRGKIAYAIVDKAESVREKKASLKKGGFRLKPIKSVVREKFLSEDWFGILDKMSQRILIPPSAILSSILPKAILSNPKSDFKDPEVELRIHKKSAIKGAFEDRAYYLRGLVREHFARKKSLLIITPRIDSIKRLGSELGQGIEPHIFSFYSALSPKQYQADYNGALAAEHPVLILGTPQILFFDRPDLETLVLEEEGSRFWRDKGFFSLDFRIAAEIIAETKKLKLLFSDQILRVETIYKSEVGLIEAINTLTGRIQSSVESKIAELKKTETFSWISNDLAQEIKEGLSRNDSILLFANRKGYSSFTICQDCSLPQLCPNCSIPLVLHKIQDARKFICHHCLKIQEIPERCQYCESWRLKDYGLGIEKVAEEFKQIFPKANSANVVIATESILSSLIKFDLIAVISVDNLFTIPDFRINETIFRLVAELKSRAKKKFILQTRLDANKLIEDAVSGNLAEFYRDEVEARKNFGYPPFVTMIKLSSENKNLSQLKKDDGTALLALKDYNPISFPAFREKIKGRYRWNILLKIADGGWPDGKLRDILENLSPIWQISVDPESII